MQAVIRTGGKQYLVEPGQVLNVELLGDSKKVELETLLVIDGAKVSVGAPLVSGLKVQAEVLEEAKGEKIKVLKFKAKKRVKKLTGHRQHYSRIKILSIGEAKAPATKSTTTAKRPARQAATPSK